MSLLIANLHCAVWLFMFVLFLPYIAEYFIAVILEFIKKHRKKKKPQREPYKIIITKKPATKWLILILVICILMGFATPTGTTPFTYLIKTMQGNTTENINEHLPMTLADQKDVLITIVIFLAILTFTKVKLRLSDFFMLAGLAYLMLASKRQQTMFAILGSVILVRIFTEYISIYFKGGLKGFTNFFSDIKTIVLLIILVVGLSFYKGQDNKRKQIVDEATYPVKACEFILKNIDLSTAKFFNEYNYGSYMLFKGIPVFIDSRADLYSPEFNGRDDDIFMDFIDTSNIAVHYEGTFKKYGITHLIIYNNFRCMFCNLRISS